MVLALKADYELKPSNQKRDYMTIMFLRGALDSTHGGADLPKLLADSSKTGTTSDWLTSMREEQDCRIIKRIYKLQESGRWSPRQMKSCPEPASQVTHWDHLLRDMKWLQTDFREERKFKLAISKQLADWCAEWHQTQPEDRSTLQVCVKGTVQTTSSNRDHFLHEEPDPMAIFAGCIDSFLMYVDGEALGDKFLGSLPLYGNSTSTIDDLAAGSYPGTTLDELEELPMDDAPAKEISPEEEASALFNPEAKHMKARLNASNAFKPPSLPLPSTAFYECRYASQWTYDEDQQLRNNIKEYTSNWPLISDSMATKSIFVPVSDRRTPWECYERLMTMEGPPADANLRQYYRHFQYRIEQARARWEADQAKHQAQLQAAGNGQNPTPLQIRRFPSPVRVDKKVNKRLVAMLDTARKLARKRENIATKQQQAQQAQQDRLSSRRHGSITSADFTEAQPPKPQVSRKEANDASSPAYWSRRKYEIACKEQDQAEMLRQRQRVSSYAMLVSCYVLTCLH